MGGAVLGAIVSAVGASKQRSAQKKARKSQERASAAAAAENRKAEELRQNQANVSAQRQRVQAVRRARIRRGQLSAASARSGGRLSSGVAGAGSSIDSNLSSSLAFSQFQEDTASQISDINLNVADITTQGNIKTAKYQGDAATFGAIGGVGQTIFQDAGGFKSIFKKIGVT